MKTPSKIFILVLFLLAFLASLAWFGVRQLADILHEFDRVAQVDLVLMQEVTSLSDLQLKKEIVFEKLSASSEELAFGQVNAARGQYLEDYLAGLSEQFDQYSQEDLQELALMDKLAGVPDALKVSFVEMHQQTLQYDTTVKAIFKAVAHGGFQLSLEDLDQTDRRQKILTENVQKIVSEVWGMVHDSINKSQRLHEQSRFIFWFSLLLTGTLGLLLFAYKKNLEELNKQKKDLEKLNRELDRFVHTVSHDIANPLTTIVGYAAYLEKNYLDKLDKRGHDCINGVRKGATRMSILIKDMLELTKMYRVRNPYSKASIQEIIDAAIANCDFLITQSSASIDVQKKMPEIVCDPIKMTAVFTNFISNAIKFSRPNVPPLIKISWNETPKEYEFYVQDNGIGIPQENHQEIFDLFKRLHPADKYDGTGVGLAIVKAALEDHGGHVYLESIQNQGTTFIFTIPKNLVPAKPLY